MNACFRARVQNGPRQARATARSPRCLHRLPALLLLALPALVSAQAPDLAGRVAKLEQALSNRGVLDLLNEIETLKADVARLRGELETQAYTIEQLRNSQTAAYVDLDRRLQGMQAPGGAAPAAPPLTVLQAAPQDGVAGAPAAQGNLQVQPQTPPVSDPGAVSDPLTANAALAPQAAPAAAIDPLTGLPVAPAAPDALRPAPGEMSLQPAPGQAPAPVSTPEAPLAPLPNGITADDAGSEAAYRDAFGLLKAGEYDQAIAAFEAFQQQFPQSQYGDNAQFWLAEAHYVKRDFAAALPAYQKMLAGYPASKKLSHAMLKIGYSYAELGKTAEARQVLDELRQRFPDTAAAQLAAQRIAQLPAN